MTEKNYNPQQKEKKAMKRATAASKVKKEIIKDIEKGGVPEKVAEKEEKIAEKVEGKREKEEKKETPTPAEKKPEKTKPKKKRDEAVVNSHSIPISTKKAADMCRFIKGKKIDEVMNYLAQVELGKKAIPMKGEIPHRKGKMMSGGFPKNVAKQFITLLKSLSGNSNVNEIDDPVIVEAVANLASRPYGRFGRWKRKRTHVKLIAREKKNGRKKHS